MVDNTSRAREQAELAFSKTQTEFMARNRSVSEIDEAIADREAKTARLRELRLEKEANTVPKAAKAKKAPRR